MPESLSKERDNKKFGTFFGVFLPGLITMMGVLIYLNLGWIVGHVGFKGALLALTLGMVITLVTALSIAVTASNGKIGSGGTYYMLSRCFGIEVGASIGIVLYIAHTICAALCVLGCCKYIALFFPLLDHRSLAVTTLVVLTGLAYTSAQMAIKIQGLILLLIAFSLATLVSGNYKPIAETVFQDAFTGAAPTSFWLAFSLLYPALTGIEAGVAMSGDLKHSSRSIMVGTVAVAFTGYFVYAALIYLLSSKVSTLDLQSDSKVLEHLALHRGVLVVGLLAAALSSALGCLLTAPRTLQAMAQDGLFPKWLARGYGPLQEPRMATFVTFLFALFGVYFGNIQQVVPILSLILLIIYGMLNLATAVESLIDTPSWRPTLRLPWGVPLFGALLTIFIILMIDAQRGMVAFAFVVLVYLLVKRRSPDTKWDDLRQSILFSISRHAIYRLDKAEPSIRSWRPNFLVLSESTSVKSPLLTLTHQMARKQGFLTLVSVIRKDFQDFNKLQDWERLIKDNLRKNRVEALVEITVAPDLQTGLKNIMMTYGMGSLVPNTVVLGECLCEENLSSYLEILRVASGAQRNMMMIRGIPLMSAKLSKEIDIWWEDKMKEHDELMLLLAVLLERSAEWRGATITVKSVVSNMHAKEEKQKYFEEFFEKGRLRMQSKIYLKEEEEDRWQVMMRFSTKTGLVFLGFRLPEEEESNELYADYYKQLMLQTKQIPSACFVSCMQDINLHEILS